MRISDIRAEFDKRNSVSRPNLFKVEFYATSVGVEYDNMTPFLSFWCKSATLPGINLRTFDYTPINYGMPQAQPYGITSEPFNCVFLVDGDHDVLFYFRNWAKKILNHSPRTHYNGMMPYELNYMDEYSCTAKVTVYSPVGGGMGSEYWNGAGMKSFSTTLYNVFPVNIGSLTLDWETNDSFTTLPVAFSYSGFTDSNKGLNENPVHSIPSIARELSSGNDVSFYEKAQTEDIYTGMTYYNSNAIKKFNKTDVKTYTNKTMNEVPKKDTPPVIKYVKEYEPIYKKEYIPVPKKETL